jgi:hypothetical protein
VSGPVSLDPPDPSQSATAGSGRLRAGDAGQVEVVLLGEGDGARAVKIKKIFFILDVFILYFGCFHELWTSNYNH